ncbi:MAG TPA: PAS domain-containing protein [Aliidongia sp.]|uniref:PAS domain-containing protein n=1 Tax=Aliidongia sp. TaxID=1914230 RepID=UPI002DDD687B|nr:PAS domain-containing protein [Aliidongia sp.]HEV2673368.1 PAS domain-containing protein [Aliidongia sp.]
MPPPAWFRPMLDYWESRRPAGRLPARADLDPVDLKDVLGWLSLIEVRPAAPRFFIRLLGSSHPPRPDGPRHGRDISAMQPAAYRQAIEEQYETAVARRAPTLHENLLSFGAYRLRYQRLTLPLAKDHETPDMLMVASLIDPIEHGRFFSALASVSKT